MSLFLVRSKARRYDLPQTEGKSKSFLRLHLLIPNRSQNKEASCLVRKRTRNQERGVMLHEQELCEGIEEDDDDEEFSHPIPWQKIEAEGLDCDYGLLFAKEEADRLFSRLEEEVEYFTGDQAKVQVYGKLHTVPRQQATYGDDGLMYSFSGVHLLARVWTPTLEYIRDAVTSAMGQTFNFVLVNRYKDGHDHIGEHRDDERELDPTCPIASVSLGAARDIIFKHRDARGGPSKRHIASVKLELAHGSLLLMNPPTNTYWYHSVPPRRKVKTPRINLTFRRVIKSHQRSAVI